MIEWLPIDTAPESRDIVWLRGSYPRDELVLEVRGFYDESGSTHGWADERYNTFYATHWIPISGFIDA